MFQMYPNHLNRQSLAPTSAALTEPGGLPRPLALPPYCAGAASAQASPRLFNRCLWVWRGLGAAPGGRVTAVGVGALGLLREHLREAALVAELRYRREGWGKDSGSQSR